MDTTVSNIGNTQFFRDGIRRVDYVLAYTDSKNQAVEAKRAHRRAVFEEQLQLLGIDLEHEPASVGAILLTHFQKAL